MFLYINKMYTGYILIILSFVSFIGAIEYYKLLKLDIPYNVHYFILLLLYIFVNYKLWKEKDSEVVLLQNELKIANELNTTNIVDVLQDKWKNIHELNCDDLVVPDIISGIEALKYTSYYWLRKSSTDNDKEFIMSSIAEDFKILYYQMNNCDSELKGYPNIKKCSWLLSADMKKTYEEISNYKN